jgi:hypothetical protein
MLSFSYNFLPSLPLPSRQDDGKTPMDMAKTQEIKDLLAAAAGSLSSSSSSLPAMSVGDFCSAAEHGDLAKVQLAVETHKLDPNCTDGRGRTPLHKASWEGHMAVVRYLVETAKADVAAKSNYGWSPLHFAAENGQVAVVQYLVETAKADVNAKNVSAAGGALTFHDASLINPFSLFAFRTKARRPLTWPRRGKSRTCC